MLQIQILRGLILIFSPAGRSSEKVLSYNPQQTLEVLPNVIAYMDSTLTKTSRLLGLKNISALQKQLLPNEPEETFRKHPMKRQTLTEKYIAKSK